MPSIPVRSRAGAAAGVGPAGVGGRTARQGRPHRWPELTARWVEELRELGFRHPTAPRGDAVRPGSLDRTAVVELALGRLGARRSAWNAADVRGEVESCRRRRRGADPGVRGELAEDLTARVVAGLPPCWTARMCPSMSGPSQRPGCWRLAGHISLMVRADGEREPSLIRESLRPGRRLDPTRRRWRP